MFIRRVCDADFDRSMHIDALIIHWDTVNFVGSTHKPRLEAGNSFGATFEGNCPLERESGLNLDKIRW